MAFTQVIKTMIITLFAMLFSTVALAQDINFSWTHDSSDNMTGYNFYVKEYPAGEFVKKWTGTESTLMFSATDGTKYGFTVTAFNEFAESLKSVELIYTTEGDVGVPIVIPSRPKVIIMQF